MSRWAVAWLAWFLAGTSLALGLAGAVFGVLNGYSPIELASEVAVGVIMAVSFPLVGALVASRRPGNSLGWSFCLIGFAEGLVTAGWEYGTYALRTRPGSVRVGKWPAGSASGAGPLGWGCCPPMRCCSSPTAGSRRRAGSRWLGYRRCRWPSSVARWPSPPAAQVVRVRRRRDLERRPRHRGAPHPRGVGLDSLLAVAGLAVVPSVPVAAGVAILRYRLYEIDRVVNIC